MSHQTTYSFGFNNAELPLIGSLEQLPFIVDFFGGGQELDKLTTVAPATSAYESLSSYETNGVLQEMEWWLNLFDTASGGFSDDPDQFIVIGETVYHLTFHDNFDTLSTWTGHGSGGIWATSISPHLHDARFLASNGEGQYFVDPDMTDLPNPFSVEDGILTIAAAPLSDELQGIADGQQFASGMLSTQLSFGMGSGYIEISANIPNQQGFLSAFWLLPVDGDWSSEIDIFETLGHDPTTAHVNVWEDGVPNAMSFPTIDMSDGFHTYGLEWTETTITWYIDGVAIYTTTNTVTEDMYLVLSLAVDTEWTGPVDGTTDFSDGFQIDYITVYEEVGGGGNPMIAGTTPFVPSVLYGLTQTDNDLYGSRWGDVVSGGDGADALYGRAGDDTLHGDGGQDSLHGHDGDDVLNGGAAGDTITAGAGEDSITGGSGDDHLWGGAWTADGAADTFIFDLTGGQDYIHDFELTYDQVDLSTTSLTWRDLLDMIEDQSWATYLNFGNDSGIYLVGITASDLTSDHFVFGFGV